MMQRCKALKIAILCACLALFVQIHAQEDSAHHIFEMTNNDRVDQGLQPLHWDPALAAAAQQHAERMAEQHALSHQFSGEPDVGARAAQAGAHFRAIAENIASAYSDQQVESAWMHSTPHRQNILDPQMDAMGVGVVKQGNVIFAVEDFANGSQALSATQVESKVASLLRRQGIDPSIPGEQAMAACQSTGGYPPGSTAKLIIRFDTGDLNQLPPGVQQQLHSGTYTKAAIAACAAPRQASFTMYRVAIELY